MRYPVVLAAVAVSLSGAVLPVIPAAGAAESSPPGHCGPGARTLSPPGARLYPETGNGGYRSVHTDVNMVYDAGTNTFLPGNNVALTDVATQCLTSFSLDFERTSPDPGAGPDLTVGKVTVNGRPADFAFRQPAYPGDPNGPDDPDPLAHEASQTSPVGGPENNQLPPACTPQPTGDQGPDDPDGTQCPADKMVITPREPIRPGEKFTVAVDYTGRPGLHIDGDGSTEGWFRSAGGSFVTTEPVGTEDWMPLNDHPSAKPTYDFYDTVNKGKTALANGQLKSVTEHAPDARFPGGSVTYHWNSGAPVASYLVEDSVGDYTLTARKASDGLTYYEAQDSSIDPAQQAANQAVMDQQQDITDFEAQFNGPFPFASDGVVVGTPPASFEEEMQTMITFAGGRISSDVLYHENMHQWWGDNVTESGYDMTFFKEGMATLGQFLDTARQAENAAGGPGTAAGRAAFTANLVSRFNAVYARTGSFWSVAPSNPKPSGLFASSSTYNRPGAAYVALWQILGTARFTGVLRQVQARYGGGSVTESGLETAFERALPNKSAACQTRLSRFFTEWFDTPYPAGDGAAKPDITGPGLDGPGFYAADGSCKAP